MNHDKHGSSKVSLSINLKKSKRKQPLNLTSNDDGIAEVFGASRQPSAEEQRLQHQQSTRNNETPLVIPVAANKFSIQDSLAKSANAQHDNGDNDYPDAPSFASESFARVPISQFGAAMLRGMGWKPHDNSKSNSSSQDDDANALPRPHRLGLGAIPKLPDDVSCSSFYAPTHSKKPRRPDQVQQDAAKQAQLREFQLERERLQARDKQVTLQNGSVVYVSLNDNDDGNDAVLNMQKSKQTSPRRAIMTKLVGVPGLNRVQVQCEGSRECVILQRRQVLGLVSRSELEKAPFLEPPPRATTVQTAMDGTIKRELLDDERQRDGRRRDEETNRSKGQNNLPIRQDDQRHIRRNDHDKNRPAKRIKSDLAKSGLHEQHQQKQQHTSWIIPHIRVRVTTEKLGRIHYRQKGTVIDVTPKGATVRMDAGQQQSLILDHVIEKHLETALPKVGGKVVIVAKSHAHYLAKGTLMERDARNSCGMIQLHQDLAVLTLSLDDLAEWCGPLDDDDE
ncbi:hypothetical protein MPSEU_000767400 [Mayamaea pseudoterrestris]|nr:hypothetical protein MPSEU_000767400 [Mayamaea pseudoterrestris]